jgi:hypothetical protein
LGEVTPPGLINSEVTIKITMTTANKIDIKVKDQANKFYRAILKFNILQIGRMTHFKEK